MQGGRSTFVPMILVAAGALVAIGATTQLVPGCADTNYFGDSGTGPREVGPPVGDGPLANLKSLRIVPLDAVLTIINDKPATQLYKALGKLPDGSELDVTARTDFHVVDPWVGVFTGALFTSGATRGGKSQLTASAGPVTATTTVTVIYQQRFFGAGVAADVDKKLDQAKNDPARAPTLYYPPDNTLLPPNLLEMEFQWTPGSGNDLFEIAVKNDGADIRFYTKCVVVGAGCGYIPQPAAWKVLVAAFKAGDPAKVTVRGTDAASLAAAGTSSARELRVAEEDITGGLYYWNAGMPTSIVRYDFGKLQQKATQFYTAGDAKALFCVGCHTMSRDGKKIAVGLDMPAPSPLKIVDVPTRTEISAGAANFMSFSPDGNRIITSDGNSMVLRDTKTLTPDPKAPNPLQAKGTMPDWSADGTRVVFSSPKVGMPLPFGTPGISEGSINIMAYDPKADAWGGTLTLVPSTGDNNYYPTFSPDNVWIIYNRCLNCDPATGSSTGGKGSSYDSKDAALWIVRADAKGKPVELKTANGGADLCNSWPKFGPFLQKYRAGKLMWVTFSSRRDYGLRLAGKSQAQIWMAAIDPAKAEFSDPSYAAFWLPFQDIKTGNHIAQWAETVVKKGCQKDTECPGGEFCDKGLCEPKGIE